MVTPSVSTATPEARERLFIDLYRQAFPAVAQYISRRGGSLEEAQDVFQDALVIYYEKQIAPATDLPHNESAYLLGIARHLWIKKYHRNPSEVPLEDSQALAWADEEVNPASPQKLLRFLTVAGQKCMDLLRAFYYDQLPLAEVADAFGYAGVRSATVQKYKCLEKVRNTVREKSLSYEDFLEGN